MTAIDKDTLQSLIDERKTVAEIAEQAQVGQAYIYKLLKRYNVEFPKHVKYSEQILKDIQHLYDQGLSVKQVAAEMKTTEDSILWATRRYQLVRPKIKRATPKLMKIRSQYFTDHMSIQDIADSWSMTYEEMKQFMTDNHFFNAPTRKMITHENSDGLVVAMDDWFDVCPMCKRNFVVRDRGAYAYKLSFSKSKIMGSKTLYFCSWSCIQKFRKERLVKKQKKESTH